MWYFFFFDIYNYEAGLSLADSLFQLFYRSDSYEKKLSLKVVLTDEYIGKYQ